jgi:lambda family phage portal protein
MGKKKARVQGLPGGLAPIDRGMVQRAFEGAKQSRRTENWFTTMGGPNTDIKAAWRWLVGRHQDLIDNEPYAAKAVRELVKGWVGDGVMGTPVGGTRRLRTMWEDWCDSNLCDFYGRTNFYGLQVQAARCVVARGSVLIRRRFDERLMRRGLPPLRLQVLEPDWLDFSRDDGSLIRFGKQFNPDGQLEGYWIRRQHPGEHDTRVSLAVSDFVPAEEICDVFETRRPGQVIGIPWGSAALLTLRDVGDRREVQLIRDKLAACFTAFVTQPNPEDVAVGGVDAYGNPVDPGTRPLPETMEPGTIEVLGPGQDIRMAQPPVSGDYASVDRHHLHAIAAAYDLPFETMTGILSEVNYSSIRMGRLGFHASVNEWRTTILEPQLLRPVAGWFSDAAQLAFGIRPVGRWTWTPPRLPMVDPSKEVPMLVQEIKAGLRSLEDVHRGVYGAYTEEVLAQLGQNLKDARRLGLALDVDGTLAVLTKGSGLADNTPGVVDTPVEKFIAESSPEDAVVAAGAAVEAAS